MQMQAVAHYLKYKNIDEMPSFLRFVVLNDMMCHCQEKGLAISLEIEEKEEQYFLCSKCMKQLTGAFLLM